MNLIKRNEWFYGDDVKGFDGDDRCGKRKRGRQRGHDGLGAFAIQPALEEREREREGGETQREREREREREGERPELITASPVRLSPESRAVSFLRSGC